jgi:hypothetical protein
MLGIEIAADLEGISTSKRRDHFVIVSVDGQEVAKSEKKRRQPAPRWEWPSDHELLVCIRRCPRTIRFNQCPLSYISLFHPSSVIKIAIYRESKTRITKYLIGQHTGKVIELLDHGEHIFYVHFVES